LVISEAGQLRTNELQHEVGLREDKNCPRRSNRYAYSRHKPKTALFA